MAWGTVAQATGPGGASELGQAVAARPACSRASEVLAASNSPRARLGGRGGSRGGEQRQARRGVGHCVSFALSCVLLEQVFMAAIAKKKSFYGIRADKGGPLKISNLPLFLGPTLAIRCICQVFLLRNIPCDQSRY